MRNRDVLIWLNSIRGIGNKTIEVINNKFENLTDLWNLSNNDIMKLMFLKSNIKNKLVEFKNEKYYNDILSSASDNNINILTILDHEYPLKLKNIYNPPNVLYYKGNINLLNKLSIAVVGSRKATYYGKWAAEKFSKELCEFGICIVSGMALGIDAISHKASLDKKGDTIAVLGSGVDQAYPKTNTNLYNDICENGLVISEFPIGMAPVAGNFPLRNRIISGLSNGLLVIEAKERSGSLITAYHALDQGKDVFAVPGNINSIYSKGTNLLIKDGAKIVTCVEDILEEMIDFSLILEQNKKNKINYDNFSKNEISVIRTIENGPIHSDMIAYNTDINIIELTSILTILEMKNIIKALPGKVFTIVN
ncbi:MAG: DNA-processing protein DprA [Senegalia sp. (in: firmicutes)]|uniref:DNA-processing protein DprA n=1 Tax=Senegalia sp. (in: firmicutes) TaxID=1924098 RepID=UPI003F9BAE10